MCTVTSGNSTLLATGDDHGTVWLWNAADGTPLRTLSSDTRGVRDMCAVTVRHRAFRSRSLLATGGRGGLVQLWDPADGTLVRTLARHRDPVLGCAEPVLAVCAVPVRNRVLLATSASDVNAIGTINLNTTMIHLRNPVNGTLIRTLNVHLNGYASGVSQLCTVTVRRRTILAAGMGSGAVQLWNPANGTLIRIINKDRVNVIRSGVLALHAVQVGNSALLAVGDSDGKVRLWDSADGTLVRTIDNCHMGWVTAICTVTIGGRILLATAGTDSTVRLWDPWNPVNGRCLLTAPVHHKASALAVVGDSLVIGHDAGVLAIDFDPDVLAPLLCVDLDLLADEVVPGVDAVQVDLVQDAGAVVPARAATAARSPLAFSHQDRAACRRSYGLRASVVAASSGPSAAWRSRSAWAAPAA
jgi:WD40 repeat protein